MSEVTYTVSSVEDMQRVAADFVKGVAPHERATVVALSGELGAGKTTFSQGVARSLGVLEAVQSPTFVIMKRYKIQDTRYKILFHIDAYRLERSEELLHLGWQEIISNPENLVLIEWPERVKEIIPEDVIRIDLKHVNKSEREITITNV